MPSGFGIQDITVNDSINSINYNNTDAQYIYGQGTVNLSFKLTYIVNTGWYYNITLPNGLYPGQQQTIIVTKNQSISSANIYLLYNDAYGDPQTFIFGGVGDTFVLTATTLGWQIIYSLNKEVPVVISSTFVAAGFSGGMLFEGQVVSQGTSPVLDIGVVYNTTGNPTFSDNHISYGTGNNNFQPYSINFNIGYYPTIYAKAYAINSVGIAYGNELQGTPNICLAKGTMITLGDGTNKAIEDISYEDDIKVWDFDIGCFRSAKPLWIKAVEKTKEYNLLKFSDGSILKTINQHRIFNKESGKFTHTMKEETPIGTTTFNVQGEEIVLESKEVIKEDVEYYCIFTYYHINLFANGVLTSCRYNNIYPICNMKFSKDNRVFRNLEEFKEIPNYYIEGLRLKEQLFSLQEITSYISNLERHKKEV